MGGDQAVGFFRKGCEKRHVLIQPKQGFPLRTKGQRTEGGVGGRTEAAIGLDKVDGLIEKCGNNLGKFLRAFLKGAAGDAAAGKGAKPLHPLAAETAVAIVNQGGLGGGHLNRLKTKAAKKSKYASAAARHTLVNQH